MPDDRHICLAGSDGSIDKVTRIQVNEVKVTLAQPALDYLRTSSRIR